MVSSSTYHAVWDGLLEVSRARHYFAAQESRLEWRAFALRFALALSGLGAVASLVESFEWLAPVSGVAITALVIVDLLWDGTTKIAQLKVVNRDLAALETMYRSFWDETRNGSITDQEALPRKNELLAALNQVAANVDVVARKKIIQQAQEDAFKVEQQRYAV